MKIGSLRWREVWRRLDPRCEQEWDALLAALQTGWNVEHGEDGTHQGYTGTVVAGGKTWTFVNGILVSLV